MIWLLASVALAAPTFTITGECPGTVRIAAENGDANTSFAIVTADASGSFTLPASTPCPGTVLPLATNVTYRTSLRADAAGDMVRQVNLPNAVCDSFAVAIDMSSCEATNAVDMSALCADSDLNGVCDEDEVCDDADGDGVCDAVDACSGDDSTGDDDGDLICNDLDLCYGDDTSGDDDADYICNDLDVCSGDDATGDDDGDLVCNDLDLCTGEDSTGDADADGVCADTDLCDDRYNPEQYDLCGIIFVDVDATGAGDGSSWADAFTTIQAAVDSASFGQDVWIAAGTYMPAVENDILLTMQAGVSLYGGFAGDETSFNARAGLTSQTILDGDFLGDDDGTIYTAYDNSVPLVIAADDVVFDGLVIKGGLSTNGFDSTDGAGVRLNGHQNVLFHDMIFRGNITGYATRGAAIGLNDGAQAVVSDSLFVHNHSDQGTIGGATDSMLEVYNSTFAHNSADEHGVDISNIDGAVISGSSFYGSSGGGSAIRGRSLVVSNSVFYGEVDALDDRDGTASWLHNAARQDYSAYGTNLHLDDSTAALSDPFTELVTGELFLVDGSAARDAGDSATADTAVPGWSTMTTTFASLGVDDGEVDLGAHHDAARPYISEFTADGGALVWTTSDNIERCDLDDAGTVYDDAASGSITVASGPYVLTCYVGAEAVELPLALDADGDGYTIPDDCDDTDPDINPGENDNTVDGVDADCDEMEVCFQDADGDGDGVNTKITSDDLTCTSPGLSLTRTDCDDTDPTVEGLDLDGDSYTTCDDDCDDAAFDVKPGVPEIEADGVDQNCDGNEFCYFDEDGDGDGTAAARLVADPTCTELGNSVSSTDCDDSDPSVEGLDLDGDGISTCDDECDDTDGIPTIKEGSDDPDALLFDGNCDGIDGDLANSVFVDFANGDDNNSGLTPEEPVKWLYKAFNTAESSGRQWVLIAGDQTMAGVNFQEGVHIAGGYEPLTWERLGNRTEVRISNRPEGKTISGWGGTHTEWHFLDIVGSDAGTGESAYVLNIADTHGLTLVDCSVTAGAAGDGADGAAGLDGTAGNTGEDGIEGGIWSDDPICEIDEVDTYPHPGNGGAQQSCTTGWGGTGGNPGGVGGAVGFSPDDPGHAGSGGLSYFGDRDADGGAGGDDDDGEPGETGVGEVHGSDANTGGASFGTLTWNASGLSYSTADGTVGTGGRAGSGGGGGGGGAGSGFPCPILGGSGGGGGGGGCGADGGTGGEGGAISVAVVLDNATITLVRSTIHGGMGGDGGAGGIGGIGGTGGAGGSGGPAVQGVYGGGDGGDGGHGGDGGAGSAGGGGPSVGIFCADDGGSIVMDNASSVAAGTPGAGGASTGASAPGTDGDAIGVSDACVVE